MTTRRFLCWCGIVLLFTIYEAMKDHRCGRSNYISQNKYHNSTVKSGIVGPLSEGANETSESGEETRDSSKQLTTRWDEVMKELRGQSPWNTSCHQLFPGIDVKQYIPDEYWKTRREVESKFKDLMEKVGGNSGSFDEEMMAYWLVAKQQFVKTVCEVGFNAGHSAMIWLTNPTANVVSFDIGYKKYIRPIAGYLKERFPRFQLHLGNSLKTVPAFGKRQPGMCDIIIIDGAHTYNMVRQDLINMKASSHPGTLLGLDDTFYGNKYGKQVMAAWHNISDSGIAKPLFHCQGAAYSLNSTRPARGFLFAKYALK